jgi:phage terminase small subunit
VDGDHGIVMGKIMLTGRQSRFVFEYCKDFNGTKAYIRAGYSDDGASAGGSRLLALPEVQEAIEETKQMLATVATLSPAWVLHHWMQIASANPNDLVKVEVFCCSECWAIADGKLPPNADCSRCKGSGESRVTIADTRKLSGAAKRLYAGAKQAKDGSIEIKMRDQDKALDNLSKYLGMLVERKELSGPGGGPLQITDSTTVQELTDAQLMALASAGSLASPLTLEAENL